MSYSPIEIAKKFVNMAIADDNPMTQMKLQKVVFFAHGLHLAMDKGPLIEDVFQAWQFGPVIPAIYRHFSKFGNLPIMDRQPLNISSFPPETEQAIHTTYAVTKDRDGIFLSKWTHLPGSPWAKTFKPGLNMPISDEVIRDYFKVLLTPKANPDEPAHIQPANG